MTAIRAALAIVCCLFLAACALDSNVEAAGGSPDSAQGRGDMPGDQARKAAEPEPASATCDNVLSGDVEDADGFTVPAGEIWCFDPTADTTVEASANVVVRGELEMKPVSADVHHTLRFVGIDETQIAGGHTTAPVGTDVGLWVVGDGVLDLEGTPRQGWNRTGTNETWRPGDQLILAPITPGDWEGFTVYDGSKLPSSTAPDGTAHYTEVMNMTRNVHIEGGGSNPPDLLSDDGRTHVFIHSSQPQSLRYAEFRYVGPRTPLSDGFTDGANGRYGLHFHQNGDASRGSVVEGTVIRDFGSHAYVPHTSHGITFTDTIAYDGWETPYWWDLDDETDDVVFDRAVAAYVKPYPSYRGYDLSGFTLGEGTNMTVKDSVAVGVATNEVNSGGFQWPSTANGDNNVWTFVHNRAHNNRDAGIAVWQNDGNNHDIIKSLSFNNGVGISHGAYVNEFFYVGVDAWGNDLGVKLHALSGGGGPSDRGVRFEDMAVDGIDIGRHTLKSGEPVVFHDVEVDGKITVDEGDGEAGIIRFKSTDPVTDLMVDDFDVLKCRSTITVDNSDGSSLRVCP